MAIGYLTITDFRTPFVDFTIPYYQLAYTYMIAKKYSTHDQVFELSNTDYPSMGILMLSAFTVSVVVGILTKRWLANPKSKYAPFWSIYQGLCQIGSDDKPSNVKQRILVIIWLFAGFITAATLSGELLAMLSHLPPKPIDTLRELADTMNIKLYIPSIPAQNFLKVSTTDIHNKCYIIHNKCYMQTLPSRSVQQIVQHQRVDGPIITADTMVRFVKNDMIANPIAFIAQDGYLNCKKKKINDQLMYIPPVGPDSTFYTEEIGIGLPKGSKLTPFMNSV